MSENIPAGGCRAKRQSPRREDINLRQNAAPQDHRCNGCLLQKVMHFARLRFQAAAHLGKGRRFQLSHPFL